jgi:hypothetical protein
MAVKSADPQIHRNSVTRGRDYIVALNWKTVTAEHVRAAMKQVAASKSDRTSGLVVRDGDRALPAKEVLRVAYRLANKLPSESIVKFSSGDGTLNVLVNLGFNATRLGADAPSATED